MPRNRIYRILPLALLLLPSPAMAARAQGLLKAWADPSALRSTFFIEGMTCRACSIPMDIHVNGKEGVYWGRFNYPLRLLTVYHDPKKASADTIRAIVDQAKEFRTVFLESRPAAEFKPSPNAPLATWKGGAVPAAKVKTILQPFEEHLRAELGDSEEVPQVRYEILGEAVRNRLLAARAKKAGFPGKRAVSRLPEVVIKEFYWPEKMLPLSPDETAIAGFVLVQVLGGDQNNRRAFENWLLNLWRGIAFEFRGEAVER
jgi:hypothetical protein